MIHTITATLGVSQPYLANVLCLQKEHERAESTAGVLHHQGELLLVVVDVFDVGPGMVTQKTATAVNVDALGRNADLEHCEQEREVKLRLRDRHIERKRQAATDSLRDVRPEKGRRTENDRESDRDRYTQKTNTYWETDRQKIKTAQNNDK